MQSRILAACTALVAFAAVGCNKSSEVRPGAQTLDFAGVTWEVLDGKWEVNGDTLTGSGGSIWTVKEFGDGLIDMDVDTPAAGPDRTMGVAFHVTGTNGDEKKANGYGFNFTSTKTFNVFKGTANNWQPITPGQNAFQKGDMLQPSHNQIHVELTGDHYRISANGLQVADFQDSAYGKGHYKLWVESAAVPAKFSQLRIK